MQKNLLSVIKAIIIDHHCFIVAFREKYVFNKMDESIHLLAGVNVEVQRNYPFQHSVSLFNVLLQQGSYMVADTCHSL